MPVLAQGNGSGGDNNAGTHDNGGNGNNASTNGADGNNKPSTLDIWAVVPEEDLLSIVGAGQASLGSLLPNAQPRTGGDNGVPSNAQLLRMEQSLVKVLTPVGRVGIDHYNARSGRHIVGR